MLDRGDQAVAYSTEHLDTLNTVLPHFPEVCEIVDGLHEIGSELSYPVDSYLSLTGQEAPDAESPSNVVLQTLARAPAYYFPVGSEADLVAKLLELRREAPIAQEPTVAAFPTASSGPMPGWSAAEPITAAGAAAAAPVPAPPIPTAAGAPGATPAPAIPS
jgi:hypothetical protein